MLSELSVGTNTLVSSYETFLEFNVQKAAEQVDFWRLLHANWMKIGLCWNYFFNPNFILHPFRTCTVSHMTACAWCLHRCLSSRSFTTRRAKTKTAWSVCDSSTKSYQTSMRYEEADGVKSCCCQHQPAGTFCLFCLFLTLSSSLCLFHAASFKAQVLLGGED